MKRILGCLVVLCIGAVSVLAQPGTPPKYATCPTPGHTCDEDLGHDVYKSNTKNGCTKWCSDLPLKITPDPIEACQNQTVQGINVRIDGAMDTKGNRVDNGGGAVNWGDGTPEEPLSVKPGSVPFNQDFMHAYKAAGTYYPSATAAQQFAYTGDGSCGYRCRSQQSDIAIVYLSNSPECATGVFKKTPASEKQKKSELKKFEEMQQPVKK